MRSRERLIVRDPTINVVTMIDVVGQRPVYTAAEFSKRTRTENAFVTRGLEQPKLWVIGSETERWVGIRELKSRLSEYVREVKRGSTILITERGRRVARIIPETDSFDERIATLRHSGTIQWSGRRLGTPKADVRARGTRTVAAIVVENRE